MKQNIFRLDISMNNVTVMHELDGVTDLFDDLLHLFLLKSALIFQLAVDVPAKAEFQNEVEVIFIGKESI